MPYLECDTDIGKVVFLGDNKTNQNILTIKNNLPPFIAWCQGYQPKTKEYAFCIPPYRIIGLTVGLIGEQLFNPDEAKKKIAGLQRKLSSLLNKIESKKTHENLLARVNRLSEENRLSKRIADFMRFIIYLSDSAKYDPETLTVSQFQTGENAWKAIEEWSDIQI